MTAREIAAGLGVAGFARNEADDSVYIEAEGEELAVRQFLDWCRVGTPWAKVERVEVTEGEVNDLRGFIVIRN